jgi:hypothetical protein
MIIHEQDVRFVGSLGLQFYAPYQMITCAEVKDDDHLAEDVVADGRDFEALSVDLVLKGYRTLESEVELRLVSQCVE